MDATLQTKLLRRAQSPNEYAAYRAALEWDLTDPIVIENREDFKSEYRWRDRIEPYHHQVTNLITFCRRLPVTLLADDVGLGKTISAGLVVSELIARSRITSVLVVCPKLLGPQWKEELNTKFDLEAEVAVGQQLIAAEPKGTGAVITTYASARLHLDKIPTDRFQMLILDEAHKLRNLYGVEKTPKVATTFRKALEERRFPFVLMLTATPIQNRLWDLYSLVDLLTVARGHQNPFGSEGRFARRFIADKRDQARKLREDARDEFRSIVYDYMSRVRRGDARLYFPEREIQMHEVSPTAAELKLIEVIAKPIQKLNRLVQISILQALVSSPQALRAQLINMAKKGTVPGELAMAVRAIVDVMPPSAKLDGLKILIDQLQRQNPAKWRLVIFTTRLETQTTIQMFLEERGLSVGIINGYSGSRNQTTIARFRKDPPELHVIVSTEAGAEGVNLQVANVLVNYDLPWNPMIVEQRIGRIQRLASQHAKVAIFNILLRGTFEEYIVGRLMEKLQMASHAIGDIEALLQASGIGDDDSSETFEEMVCRLVVESLAGKNMELETRQAEASIERARTELEQQQATIGELLGSADGKEYAGPRAPRLPPVERSMTPREFALTGLAALGSRVIESDGGIQVHDGGSQEFVHFEGDTPRHPKSSFYAPGSASFQRLISRLVATGIHDVRDRDDDAAPNIRAIAGNWTGQFGSSLISTDIRDVRRRFSGAALVRARVAVAHDAYERLVQVRCDENHASEETSRSFLAPLVKALDDPRAVGISPEHISVAAEGDAAIAEFCRFYLERRELEKNAAGDDARKRKKLEDEFTPHLQMSLVGLEGEMHREVTLLVKYRIDDAEYTSTIAVTPSRREVIEAPALAICAKSGRSAPVTCMGECAASGARVLAHLLIGSAKSGRRALPEYIVKCALSGKHVLSEEAERSAISGQLIDKALLKTSALSGMRGEPEYFGRCAFTNADVLTTELAISDVSGKPYRQDQRRTSVVSHKTGHKDEFIVCSVTGHSLLRAEAERCEVTGSHVEPGRLNQCESTGKRVLGSQLQHCELTGKHVLRSELEKCQASGKAVLRSELAVCQVTRKRVLPTELETCQISGKTVLPSELERCSVSGKRALQQFFVTSSVNSTRLLEDMAIKSSGGKFCTPTDSRECAWTGQKSHPDDLRTCDLTGLLIRHEFVSPVQGRQALQPLNDLLQGLRRNSDKKDIWESVASRAAGAIGRGKCQVEAAILSPTGAHLATSIEVRTMLGLKTRQAGLLYAITDDTVVGRIAHGQRKPNGWMKLST